MNWYKKIWSPKSLVVVFLHFEEEQVALSVLKVGKNSKTLNLEDAQHFENVSEIVSHFGKSVPYHLHVSGTGVLSRKVTTSPNFKEELIINSNIDEFNFTTYDDGISIVASFFRSALIQSFIEELKTLKIHVIAVSSGETPLFTLLKENEQLSFESTLSKKNGNIDGFVRNEKATQRALYNHNYYSKPQLLAIVLYSQLKAPDEKYANSEDLFYTKAKENYAQFQQFKFYGVSVLSGLLLALIVNYFYQNKLNTSISELEYELTISNNNLSLLERLEQEKSRKLLLVQNAGVNSTKFISFYLDEIGRTTPSQIYLTDLELYPIVGKLKNKHRVEVDNNSILVSGVTFDNEILDDWIEKLDEFEWVKSIELLNYLKNEEGRAGFNLLITLIE